MKPKKNIEYTYFLGNRSNLYSNKVYKDESENKTLLKLFIIDFYTSRIEWALKEMHRDKNGNNLFFYKLLHSR